MKTIILALAVLCTTVSMTQDKKSKLPNVTLKTLDGKNINSNTFSNDGKPFVVNIWATWCSPCKRELNTIHEVYEDWQDETGVKIIAISMDDARNMHKVAPYVNGKGWEYECYIDPNQDFVRAVNCINPPQTLLYDGTGKLVWQHNGYVDGDEDELFEQIKKYSK